MRLRKGCGSWGGLADTGLHFHVARVQALLAKGDLLSCFGQVEIGAGSTLSARWESPAYLEQALVREAVEICIISISIEVVTVARIRAIAAKSMNDDVQLLLADLQGCRVAFG